MTASILDLKHHARCNIALSILTNVASKAVLNDVTLGCWDLFVILSTLHSSSRNLNLGFGRPKFHGPTLSTLSESQFGIKWLVWVGPPSCWKTYGLPDAIVSIHDFTTSIRTRNDCRESSEISAWTLSMIAGVLCWHTGIFVGLF